MMCQNTVQGRKKSEVTRLKLMDAALAVFWDKGFAHAQITDIVRSAGKSVGLFYRYFDSKTALLDALLDDFGDEQHWYLGAETGLLVTTQRMFVMEKFWGSYIRHGALMRALHQAAAADKHFQDRLDALRANGIKAVAHAVKANWPAAPGIALRAEFVAEMVTTVMERSATYWSLNSSKLRNAGLTETDAFNMMARLVDTMILQDRNGLADTGLSAYVASQKRAGNKN